MNTKIIHDEYFEKLKLRILSSLYTVHYMQVMTDMQHMSNFVTFSRVCRGGPGRAGPSWPNDFWQSNQMMIRGHKKSFEPSCHDFSFENQKSACYDQLKLTAFFIGQPAIICCPFAWLLIYRQAARLFARPWLNSVLEKLLKFKIIPK